MHATALPPPGGSATLCLPFHTGLLTSPGEPVFVVDNKQEMLVKLVLQVLKMGSLLWFTQAVGCYNPEGTAGLHRRVLEVLQS